MISAYRSKGDSEEYTDQMIQIVISAMKKIKVVMCPRESACWRWWGKMRALRDVFCVEKWIWGKNQPCKELAGNLSRKRKPWVVQPRDMNELGCLRNRKRHMWLEARNRGQTIGLVWLGREGGWCGALEFSFYVECGEKAWENLKEGMTWFHHLIYNSEKYLRGIISRIRWFLKYV